MSIVPLDIAPRLNSTGLRLLGRKDLAGSFLDKRAPS